MRRVVFSALTLGWIAFVSSTVGAQNPGGSVFRAGIWTPRPRPNPFEGVGMQGLPWLRKVKEETGLLTTCEVANAKHTEQAIIAGVDILWIGARTTANPFSVQEIADALTEVTGEQPDDVTVLVMRRL